MINPEHIYFIFASWLISIIALIWLSVIDIRTYKNKGGGIPSVVTSGLILVNLIFNYNNDYFLVFFAIFALFLLDFKLFEGMADLKLIIALGPTVYKIEWMAVFFTAIVTLAVIGRIIFKKNIKDNKEMPFIPVIAVSYIITMIYMVVSMLF